MISGRVFLSLPNKLSIVSFVAKMNHMYTVENYLMGQWVKGEGEGQLLYNAVTGVPIANATAKGLDFSAALHYARSKGNPALRK